MKRQREVSSIEPRRIRTRSMGSHISTPIRYGQDLSSSSPSPARPLEVPAVGKTVSNSETITHIRRNIHRQSTLFLKQLDRNTTVLKEVIESGEDELKDLASEQEQNNRKLKDLEELHVASEARDAAARSGWVNISKDLDIAIEASRKLEGITAAMSSTLALHTDINNLQHKQQEIQGDLEQTAEQHEAAGHDLEQARSQDQDVNDAMVKQQLRLDEWRSELEQIERYAYLVAMTPRGMNEVEIRCPGFFNPVQMEISHDEGEESS
ncbi:hypothetical protein FZEAL_4149 [Fusarium zealandicum]|uniref:Uncharacterized protein n=1 Tax=Fusarium zealandicum TaxID=1053134 RepID=A0A8H4UMG1_9HYPO|nr:hypothetical protein FZEAL_4149 [Fusarium zealandicum]